MQLVFRNVDFAGNPNELQINGELLWHLDRAMLTRLMVRSGSHFHALPAA